MKSLIVRPNTHIAGDSFVSGGGGCFGTGAWPFGTGQCAMSRSDPYCQLTFVSLSLLRARLWCCCVGMLLRTVDGSRPNC